MTDDKRTYHLEQLGRPQQPRGLQENEDVTSLGDLVTHHPGNNRDIRMQDGQILGAERPERRSHAYIDGQFQEVIDSRVDKYGSLKKDQVLLVKDFILEDPSPVPGQGARAVDMPSPTAGYVSRVSTTAGMVEIMDRQGGEVIARLRHMSDIAVKPGDEVVYGQRLGQQNNLGLDLRPGVGMHAHVEMDAGHYQQFENYISDLASGRLPVQATYRDGVQPLAVEDDSTLRLGQSSARIADLQQVMTHEGYRGPGGEPLDQDGVYRHGMQGALLDFQRAHGVPQTGNIDAATLNFAPMRDQWRDMDSLHAPSLNNPGPIVYPPAPRAPGHPDHEDHRRDLPGELPPAVNQHLGHQARAPQSADPLAALSPNDQAMFRKIRDGVPEGVSDEAVASAMHAAKQDGMTKPESIANIGMVGDQLWIGGVTPGYRAMVDTAQQMPPLQETFSAAAKLDSQVQAQTAEQTQGQRGPVLS